jgi:putative addiction module component (TIGR02574 family)
MPSTAEIMREVEALPVEERALIADSLLRSLNPPNRALDRKWAAAAQKRLEEVRSGRVQTIPGDAVFAEIGRRFAL